MNSRKRNHETSKEEDRIIRMKKLRNMYKKIPTQGTKLIANDIGVQMEQVGITKHVVEHIYDAAQPCTTCALLEVLIFQLNVVA